MTERPIIFSAPMVRAILAGTKTQTRRILKPRTLGLPVNLATHGVSPEPYSGAFNDPASWGWPAAEDGTDAPISIWPEWWGYRPGDTLWVRETWMEACELDENDDPASELRIYYRADGRPFDRYLDPDTGSFTDRLPWRPSIHMPRRASRITLRVTDVRVERLQDISQEDAKAEGATSRPNALRGLEGGDGWCMDWSRVGLRDRYGWNGALTEACVALSSPRMAFANYWNHIHGPGAWAANPWVVAITFERIKAA